MALPSEGTFGDLVRRLRKAAGLTQAELAERAGLSPRGLNDLERGAARRPAARRRGCWLTRWGWWARSGTNF